MDLKVGGIYALERIAHDSRVDRLAIREILAAYVRGHSRWLPDKAQVVSPDRKLSDLPPLRTRTDDVQMALTVLARKSLFGPQLDHGETAGQLDPRNTGGDDSIEPERIILAEVDLRGAYLRDAALGRVDFTNAHLERADLIRADLQDARLSGVHLRQAILTNANLSRAYVVGGKLQGVHLESARLNQSQLMNADLPRSPYDKCRPDGSELKECRPPGANMTSCNLKNCDLRCAWSLRSIWLGAGTTGYCCCGAAFGGVGIMGFDDNLELPAFQIETAALRVTEENASSDGIISEDQPFSVTMEFELPKSISPSSRYTVDYFYESLGAGPEGTLASVTGQLDPNMHQYGGPDTTVHVEAGTLFKGIYRLTCEVNISGRLWDTPRGQLSRSSRSSCCSHWQGMLLGSRSIGRFDPAYAYRSRRRHGLVECTAGRIPTPRLQRAGGLMAKLA